MKIREPGGGGILDNHETRIATLENEMWWVRVALFIAGFTFIIIGVFK